MKRICQEIKNTILMYNIANLVIKPKKPFAIAKGF